MTKNQSYGIVALTTEPQKIFVQTLDGLAGTTEITFEGDATET